LVEAYDVAAYYLYFGELDKGFDLLEQSYANKESHLWYLWFLWYDKDRLAQLSSQVP
jgi:hypothetical protein